MILAIASSTLIERKSRTIKQETAIIRSSRKSLMTCSDAPELLRMILQLSKEIMRIVSVISKRPSRSFRVTLSKISDRSRTAKMRGFLFMTRRSKSSDR